MTFRVGQKVVCVEGPTRPLTSIQQQIGEVYTVRATRLSAASNIPSVLLDEIVNEFNPVSGTEWGFYAFRFRPVVENKRKTDIAVFQRILDSVKQTERA